MMTEPTTPSSPTGKLYRIKRGKKHSIQTADGIRHLHAGQIVELTTAQAKSWRDKFEPAPKAIAATPESEAHDPLEEQPEDEDDEEFDEEEEDDTDETDEEDKEIDPDAPSELPAGDPNESPIARRRREKRERKARRAK